MKEEELELCRAFQVAHPQEKGDLLDKAKQWQENGPTHATTYPLSAVGKNVCFLKNVIQSPFIDVGEYTYYHDYEDGANFERDCIVYHEPIIEDRLIIGKFCQIALGTRFIMNASHHQTSGFSTFPFAVFNENWAASYQPDFPNKGNTVIGNDVWLGHQCCIMPGVTIGDGAIIATRALVVKDVPPYTIVGGNPAKEIRKRFSDEIIEELLEIRWWDWPIEKIRQNLSAITSSDIQKLRNAQSK